MGLLGDRVSEIVENIRDMRRIDDKLVISDEIKKIRKNLLEGRVNMDECLEIGDVIKINRYGYAHYAIYAGFGDVIHFAPEGKGDFKGVIHRANQNEFLNGQSFYHIVRFYPDQFDRYDDSDIRLYEGYEVVRRAESKINQKDYHLLGNNCEHFACWCKTGIAESSQVKRMVSRDFISGLKRVEIKMQALNGHL